VSGGWVSVGWVSVGVVGAVGVGPVTVSKPVAVPVPVPGAVVDGTVGAVNEVSGGSGPVTGGRTAVAVPGTVAVAAVDPPGAEPSSLATA
jgi:hypothetical protein